MRPSSLPSAALAALLSGLSCASPALADHHRLKRALQDARCIARSTTVVERQGALTVYDVTCLGPEPDRVLIVCNGRVCRPDDPDDGRDEETP
ncbi:hypothetical protein [Methylobacterium oryzisoli]|uniref:hypothetical protein n=1 Tax=Methylobacterium oryzisoli TaxID=3385502 RepID=UPI0038924B81